MTTSSKGVELVELDAPTVSAWLDAHPEYITEYVRRLQIQRRRSSIMNELVLADLAGGGGSSSSSSSLLLRSQFSNTSSSSTIDETSRLAALIMNSGGGGGGGANHAGFKFPSFLFSSSSASSSPGIGCVNSAFSEPSILPNSINETTGLEHSDLPDMSEIITYRCVFFAVRHLIWS